MTRPFIIRTVPKITDAPSRDVLSSLLRQVRVEAGLTQAQLAELLKQPQSFVSKYESGERRLDLIEIKQICQALELSLAEFVKRFEELLG
jgi:transcriptional regulator with XRE-family HTH domain